VRNPDLAANFFDDAGDRLTQFNAMKVDSTRAALPGAAASARLQEIDSLTEAQRQDKNMRPSLLEDNVVHHEDFELARSVKWELMRLRSRSTTPTADDIMLIARKAGLAEFLRRTRGGGTTVNVVRADAWLAICMLADSIAKNARSIRKYQHDRVVDASLLWARAIDLCNAWMRAAE
jgi:hypothetical protein